MLFGKPGPRTKKFCNARVEIKYTKRGVRYAVTHPETPMRRYISKADYEKALGDGEICAYLLEPPAKK